MKTLKKILCVSFAFILLLCSFAGCGSANRIKSTTQEAKVIGTCGDYDVRYEELRYLALTHKAEMEHEFGEGIFDGAESDSYEQELWKRVEASLCDSYAKLDVCEKAGVKRSDKQTKKEVQNEIDSVVAALGGEEAYRAYLAETGLTDTVNRLYTAIVSCQYRYYYEVAFDELEKEAYDAVLAHEGFVHTMSIFVKNDEGERVEDNRKMAEYVREQVMGGEALVNFIGTKYNQDMSNCEYYFPRGYMDDAYEEAAFALELDEVSDVVETEEGFYVIQRLALDEAYFELNMETLIEKYIVGKINLAFEAHAKTLSFELNEYGKTLTLRDMK